MSLHERTLHIASEGYVGDWIIIHYALRPLHIPVDVIVVCSVYGEGMATDDIDGSRFLTPNDVGALRATVRGDDVGTVLVPSTLPASFAAQFAPNSTMVTLGDMHLSVPL